MNWYEIENLRPNFWRISEPVGLINTLPDDTTSSSYLVIGTEKCVLIDSGLGICNIKKEIEQITNLPCTVLNTHFHFDHIGGNHLFKERIMHPLAAEAVERPQDMIMVRQYLRRKGLDPRFPEEFDLEKYKIIAVPTTGILTDQELFDLGNLKIKALHTPGHSNDHLSFWIEELGILCTGDVFYNGILTPMGTEGLKQMLKSIDSLACLNPALICPGHNEVLDKSQWLHDAVEWLGAVLKEGRTGKVTAAEMGYDFSGDKLTVTLPRARSERRKRLDRKLVKF